MVSKYDNTPCSMCGKLIEHPTKRQKDYLRKFGVIYCCQECSKKKLAQVASINMTKTNLRRRDIISKRMKEQNPMSKEEVREKVSNTLKAMNWKPKVHGGNGCGLTVPQQMLLNELDGFVAEFAIKTGFSQKDNSGYPTCYKVDLANEKLKIAIEVDGFSHCSLKAQERDAKKEKFLISIGWKVLRFKNAEILNNVQDCVQKVKSMI